MIKKILLSFLCLVFINPFFITFADKYVDPEPERQVQAQKAEESSIKKSKQEEALAEAQAEHDKKCDDSGNCIEKPNFTISVNSFSPGRDVDSSKSSSENVNSALSTIIKMLMIGLGSLSTLIMTIGAGYIIFYHGEEDLLSKGKSIFTGGIIAMIIALSSYVMVDLVASLLY